MWRIEFTRGLKMLSRGTGEQMELISIESEREPLKKSKISFLLKRDS